MAVYSMLQRQQGLRMRQAAMLSKRARAAASAAIARRDSEESESDRESKLHAETECAASSSDAEIEDVSSGHGPSDSAAPGAQFSKGHGPKTAHGTGHGPSDSATQGTGQSPSDSAVQGTQQSNGHGPSAGAQSAHYRKQLSKIEGYGLHFSKICSQYRFEPTASAYMAWRVQIEAVAEEWNLRGALETDPATVVDKVGIEEKELSRLQQKTVYHMILRCVPNAEVRTVITTALSADKHTGFHAWRALREHFIGDEQALRYVQSIEDRFKDFQWAAEETWASFETRFTSLVSELVVAGVHKQPHQKRACLMEAIRDARRKDAQGTPVFARLNTVNIVKEGSEFQQWVTAMRIEAQKIHDELSKKGSKRTREESESQEERKQESHEVSFIAESASAPAPRHDPPRNISQIPCRNFANFGQCRFGNTCRFSHTRSNISNQVQQGRQIGHFRPPGGLSNRFVSNNNRSSSSSSNGSRGDNLCFSWRDTGRCQRTNCRFQHPAVAPNAA